MNEMFANRGAAPLSVRRRSETRSAIIYSILVALSFASNTRANAEQRFPFPGQPGFSEALAKITAKQHQTRAALENCTRRYVDRFVSSNSDALSIVDAACSSCPKERKNNNDVEADFFVFLNATNPSYHGGQEHFVAGVRSSATCGASGLDYATAAIGSKRQREIDARASTLLEIMKEKLQPALECNDRYSSLFALNTSESPENIANTAFGKCASLFEDAATARVDPVYTGKFRLRSIAALVDEMRKDALERTIATVVVARARQRLIPQAPPAGKTLDTENRDVGI